MGLEGHQLTSILGNGRYRQRLTLPCLDSLPVFLVLVDLLNQRVRQFLLTHTALVFRKLLTLNLPHHLLLYPNGLQSIVQTVHVLLKVAHLLVDARDHYVMGVPTQVLLQ